MTVDTIIIGAGAMGSSTAYWLSKYQDVLLIEQNDLLHHEGSSHGQSRVIRKTYRQSYFSEMMKSAYQLWNEVQEETGISVFSKVGGLDVGREGNEDMNNTLEVCSEIELDHEVLDANKLREKYPAYIVNDDYWAIYQPDTGILNASKAVDMFHQQTVHQGAQIITSNPVKRINQVDDEVLVETAKGDFRAKQVIITAGSWINEILKQFHLTLDIEVWQITFAYWRTKNSELYQKDKFPVFIHWDQSIDYGFPIQEREGYVKIAPHINSEIDKTYHHPQTNPKNKSLLNHTANFIDQTFQGIDTKPEFTETCLYTMTKDENFIIDTLPEADNIFIAAGFSGHGFKFTPLIGNIIQKEIMNESHKWDLSHFDISSKLL